MNNNYKSTNAISGINEYHQGVMTNYAVPVGKDESIHYGNFFIEKKVDLVNLSKYSIIKGNLIVKPIGGSGMTNLFINSKPATIEGSLIIKNDNLISNITLKHIEIGTDCEIANNSILSQITLDNITIEGVLTIKSNAPKVTHDWDRVRAKGGIHVE